MEKIIPYSGRGQSGGVGSRADYPFGEAGGRKTKNACICLSEDRLEDWCREHQKNKDFSLVLLVEENCDFLYGQRRACRKQQKTGGVIDANITNIRAMDAGP